MEQASSIALVNQLVSSGMYMCMGWQRNRYLLEIVRTQIFIPRIAMKTSQTSGCSFLAWIEIFAISLAKIQVRAAL